MTSRSDSKSALNDKSILVIDDEPNVLYTLERILVHRGYTVFSAQNGLDGLTVLKSRGIPDAVILDLKIPGLDGIGVCQAIRRSFPTLPVFIFSGALDETVRKRAFSVNATDCIPKTEIHRIPNVLNDVWTQQIATASKVLFVNNPNFLVKNLCQYLESLFPGSEFTLTTSGAETNDWLRAHRPAMVFIDWELSDNTALDILKILNRQWPGTPCIVMTQCFFTHHFERILKQDVSFVINKPYPIKDLVAAINESFRAKLPDGPSQRAFQTLQSSETLTSTAALLHQILSRPESQKMNFSELTQSVKNALTKTLDQSDKKPIDRSRIKRHAVVSANEKIKQAFVNQIGSEHPESQNQWLASLPVLESIWGTSADILPHFTMHKKSSILFVPMSAGDDFFSCVRIGQLLKTILHIKDREMSFALQAKVIAYRQETKDTGIYVRFLSQEHSGLEKLRACINGQPLNYARRAHTRHSCFLPIRMHCEQQKSIDAVATDISLGGMRIGTLESLLSPDKDISVEIPEPNTDKKLRVFGKVAYTLSQCWPQTAGIAFHCSDRTEQIELQSIIDHLGSSQDLL